MNGDDRTANAQPEHSTIPNNQKIETGYDTVTQTPQQLEDPLMELPRLLPNQGEKKRGRVTYEQKDRFAPSIIIEEEFTNPHSVNRPLRSAHTVEQTTQDHIDIPHRHVGFSVAIAHEQAPQKATPIVSTEDALVRTKKTIVQRVDSVDEGVDDSDSSDDSGGDDASERYMLEPMQRSTVTDEALEVFAALSALSEPPMESTVPMPEQQLEDAAVSAVLGAVPEKVPVVQQSEPLTLTEVKEHIERVPLPQILAEVFELCVEEPADETQEVARVRQLVIELHALVSHSLPHENVVESSVLTPEITDRLLVLLRALGREDPSAALIEYVKSYGAAAVMRIVQNVAQIDWEGALIERRSQTRTKIVSHTGSSLQWLVSTLMAKLSLTWELTT